MSDQASRFRLPLADGALAGRHALITGGGRGIGAAIAEALAAAGAQVSLAGRSVGPLKDQTAKIGAAAQAVPVDVQDADAVAHAFAGAAEAFGAIDILVNNAGIAQSAPFAKTDDAAWDRALGVNLLGPRNAIRAVLPGMVDRGWGRIITIASTAGLRGYAYTSAYCASKHAVIGLTRALALELARKGVTVNAVCPGFTDTDIVAESIARIQEKTGRTAEQARADLTQFNPQSRLIDPAEVAGAVAYLATGAAASLTGQAIAVAGGEVM
jgi:NAD(P)-dependent dehydrogenase (short-subunit alcohol dehydrogenase family)